MRGTLRLALAAGTVATCSAAQAQVVNGGFESGTLSGWTVTATDPTPVVINTDFHTGSFSALVGSDNGAEPLGDGAMYQSITVPAGGGVLSFWHKRFTTDSIFFDWQDAYIQDGSGNTLSTIFHVCVNSDWTQEVVDLSPFAGTTIRIAFLVHQDGFGDDTSMKVDDVTFSPGAAGACCVSTGSGCAIRTQADCTAQGGTWNGPGSNCGSVVCPGVYSESGDAGELPSTAGIPTGTGGLFRINGSYASAGDVDMYLIRVCDVANFRATMVGQTTEDTQLFLFTSGGMGVVFDDDDAAAGTLQSTITNAFVSSPGNYFLAVSGYNRDAVSVGGPIFPDLFPGEYGPSGAGGGSQVSGWSGNHGNIAPYGVSLTGACYPNLTLTGACCRADGTCAISGMQACFAGGGTYGGDGSACGSCPQPGACCHSNGTCSFGQQSACIGSGGTFQGQSVACASVTCPIQYVWDDGVAENAIGLTAGGAICAANQFTITAGADKITHIKISFGVPETLNGMPVTAYLWSDPNNDGNPSDAHVLASATGVVAGAQPGVPVTNPTWVDFDIPDFTLPIGTSFFIGFVMDQNAGQYPAAIDQSSSALHSWVGYAAAAGGFDPNAWTNVSLIDSLGFPGNWTIRADATAGNPNATGACCGSNGTCVSSITLSACQAQGGAWQGENVTCAAANCQPIGACCRNDGSCSANVAQNACLASGGTFRGAGSTCAAPCPMPPNTWIEQGDAGALPAGAQITQGADPLNTVRGNTGSGDLQDMFQIRICDVGNFSAAACGSGFDTQLWLFNSAGMGVVANDDTCGLQSTINGSTGCLSSSNNGLYYLAISGYDCDPSSSGGLIFDTNSTFSAIVCATNTGSGQPVSSWGATGGTGAYQIAFTGACFAAGAGCYANCDNSTTPPVANVADFTCFLQKFAAQDPYANCDGSTLPPTINVADFTCFLQKFAAGCP
jgi:hypothetical protein